MSDYDQRNKAFDYTPPSRGGSGTGVLMLVGGLIALFFLAMLFIGAGSNSPLPAEGAAPGVTPTDAVPAAPVITGPVTTAPAPAQ